MSTTKDQAKAAKKKLAEKFPGVTLGLGKSGDNHVVTARFESQEKATATSLPKTSLGVKVLVEVVGEISAQ